MATLSDIDRARTPQHVAIIMDGNGRWAKAKAQRRIYGHQHALKAVREAVEASVEMGVKYLTLYTFSTENWNRPEDEVMGLMDLFVKAVKEETPMLKSNGIKLLTIGDISRLPQHTLENLRWCESETAGNTTLTLILALSYSSRWEIKEALKAAARDARNGLLNPDDVTEETLRQYLVTKDFPDPDLLIRTGGEQRTSNFLQWQMAYTEFYFSTLLWPDFRREHFYEAVVEFQSRQRRFGKTGDQVESSKEEF